MKRCRTFALVILALVRGPLEAQEILDRLDQTLTLTAFNDQVRAHVSGVMDLEGYYFQQPPPGLIDASGNVLFNPRLSLFLDAQLGPELYLFVQSRFDRGFDPSDHDPEARADEYALRLTPWNDGRLNVQIGKFATVVGSWVERHLSWDNPFVTAPLPYENRTGISDVEAPASANEFIKGPSGATYEYNPVIWGPSYTTGASVSGRIGSLDYAADVKNAALSSHPEVWSATDLGYEHPAFSGRLAFRPNLMWTFGLSASDARYFSPEAEASLPIGHTISNYHQRLLGQDAAFAWHHLQVWAEFYETRFEVPRVGNADTFVYYVETKYKFTPQFFGAVRWNQQFFGDVRTSGQSSTHWGADTWRTDFAVGYRFTERSQLKLQYNLQHDAPGARDFGHLVAGQFTIRF